MRLPLTFASQPLETETTLAVVVSDVPHDPLGAVLCTGSFDTVIGRVVAFGAEGVLWALGIAAERPEADVRNDLAARFPGSRLVDAPEALAPAITALLTNSGEIRIRLAGSDFQNRVWRALLNVPAGEVVSYAMLAAMIGQPKALRAVGTAVGQNPVSWVVPCHRVTRTDGTIGGYHWGASVKRALLVREGASIAPRLLGAL